MVSRQVNFGLWYDFRNPPPSTLSFEDLYQENLKQIAVTPGETVIFRVDNTAGFPHNL